jgi:peptide/nickel transport system permease protein
MPGSPINTFIQPGRIRDPAQLEAIIKSFGLDQPAYIRYLIYVKNMFTFNFGVSYQSQKPVASEMSERMLNTFLLVGVSTILSMVVGIIVGVYTAYKRGSAFDSGAVLFSLAFYSLPSFWIGMVLLMVFGVYLGWFPIAGATPREWGDPNIWPTPPQWPQDWLEIIRGRLYHMALPVGALFLFQVGGYILLTRAVMIETLTDDYVLTARAKGLPERIVLFKHALKNGSLPLITNIALSFAFMFSGAIITEQVFTYRGMGWWIWNSIAFYDYPVLQAVFYVLALCVVAANFIADVAYGLIDPRVKYG